LSSLLGNEEATDWPFEKDSTNGCRREKEGEKGRTDKASVRGVLKFPKM
jgi:hypothetical protein